MALIKIDHIFMKQNLGTQDEVMHFLAEQGVLLGISSDQTAVYHKFLVREEEGTTGMMDGFAIPHAKDQSIEEAAVVIVQLTNKIDWKSLDGEGTEFVIALFIPDSEAGTTHLKLLSQVARLLMQKEVTNHLKQAQSPAEIAEILNGKLVEN
jgi:PTS system fructose-specific IIA component